MKKILFAGTLAVLLVGCAREDNAGYDTGAAPVSEGGTGVEQNNTATGPNDAAGANYGSGSRERAGETAATGAQSGVGAASAMNSGTGTATAQGAVTSDTGSGKQQGETQNLDGSPLPPSGASHQTPKLPTNGTSQVEAPVQGQSTTR